MKTKLFIAAFIITAAVLIAYSQINRQPFAPAADFPREALIYVQVADLPAVIKLWNESELKDKYLSSSSFDDFQNNHLGRKLASRWREFNAAVGFSVDLEVLSGIAANQAAVAIYDVGKLEFVFIAPVSDELFAATKFARTKNKFTEERLSDGTLVYRVNVEADRGRQQQELIFSQIKNRFVLATSEKLLAQTLNNINGKQSNNRLIDEPAFAVLSKEIAAHTATVWLNQTILNDDYYFKRYWLMSDVKDLKNMRAGIFDFEMQEGKYIERRKFLLNKTVKTAPIESAEAARMLALLPPNIPFYRLQTADRKTVNEAIEKMFFARRQTEEKTSQNYYSNYSYFNDYDDYSSGNYESLSENFDEAIDEKNDEEAFERIEAEIDFADVLRAANPRAVLTFTQPVILPAPMFVEFQKAAVFSLSAEKSLDRNALETAIAAKLAARTLIAEPQIKLIWETKKEGDDSWRELNLPMLGWSVAYAVRGDKLILTDDGDFLKKILAARDAPLNERHNSPLAALTVVNFAERESGYDQVFDALNRNRAAEEFFTGNIGSLLDALGRIEKIEIKESYSERTYDEEITFDFQ